MWVLINEYKEVLEFPFTVKRDEEHTTIVGGRPPHKASSTGFVRVDDDDFGMEYYAHCYNLKWIEVVEQPPRWKDFVDGWMAARPPKDDGKSCPPNTYDNLDKELPRCLGVYCKRFGIPILVEDYKWYLEQYCFYRELF